MLNGLDLFSGIGGLTKALGCYVVPVAYCENDAHAQAVLFSRMYRGDLPFAPVWDDVRTLRAVGLPEVDIIYGGFPCQDISAAGRGAGLDGERSGLYWQIHRLVRECKPSFVFLENVPAIRTRGLESVVRSLTDLGYDCRWTVISAAEVGAPHLRKRWFLLAYSDRDKLREQSGRVRRAIGKETSLASVDGSEQFVADTESERRKKGRPERSLRKWESSDARSGSAMGDPSGARSQRSALTEKTWAALSEHRYTSQRDWPSWLPKPALPRGDNGLLFRVDRTHGLGNAVVPVQAETAYERLMGYSE